MKKNTIRVMEIMIELSYLLLFVAILAIAYFLYTSENIAKALDLKMIVTLSLLFPAAYLPGYFVSKLQTLARRWNVKLKIFDNLEKEESGK